MELESKWRRRERNGNWRATHHSDSGTENRSPPCLHGPLSRPRGGDVPQGRAAGENRGLGARNEQCSCDHFMEHGLHCACDPAQRRVTLARASSRPPVFGAKEFSAELSLAVTSLRDRKSTRLNSSHTVISY